MFFTTPIKKHIFSSQDLSQIDFTRVPQHIAIVPDGNRRWAKKHLFTIAMGHETGAENILDIVLGAKALGAKYITFYLFSTENWNRDKFEVNSLMNLYEKFFRERRQDLLDHSIRFHTIGEINRLPKSLQKEIQISKEASAHCSEINLITALNYGSRDELTRAFKKILLDVKEGKIIQESINEQTIRDYLDTAGWPDPELLIRTSGESRVSNYLLWQICYSEIYISDILWPDFKPCHLLEAVKYFQTRDRRLGGG